MLFIQYVTHNIEEMTTHIKISTIPKTKVQTFESTSFQYVRVRKEKQICTVSYIL